MDMPTTQLTIMRGAAVDDAGDVSEVGVPIYLHMPAALLDVRLSGVKRTSASATEQSQFMSTRPGI